MASNTCVLIGGQQAAVDRQTARSHCPMVGAARVIIYARPRPVFRTARRPCLHRVELNILPLSLYSLTVRGGRQRIGAAPAVPILGGNA